MISILKYGFQIDAKDAVRRTGRSLGDVRVFYAIFITVNPRISAYLVFSHIGALIGGGANLRRRLLEGALFEVLQY